MTKINIKARLFNVNENENFYTEVVGTLENNEIKYVDKNVETTVKKVDEALIIKRVCEDYNIELYLDLRQEKPGLYKIKHLGELKLITRTNSLKFEENKIDAEYELIIDDEEIVKFKYSLEYNEE